ncbi:unnamed protein product [Phytophthora fragariaefolia]|uniref:Unnamed protein product n=1 Tax=Phytophthora fragariaefolia TaxID=1490495 RepID=A0A9W6XJJ6_9STRA|nr:unnamed protein product [Phytophthora fragariaefolia]
MASLFGEEAAEYGGDASSNSVQQAAAAFDKALGTAEDAGLSVESSARAVPRQQPAVRDAQAVGKKSSEKRAASGDSSVRGGNSSGDKTVDVLLLQGPCSFVRNVWTG